MFASCYCKTLVKFCFLQCIFLNLAVPSHIVGFPNLNFISHSRVLWKLGKELTTRGHRYTQLLGDCAKETSLPDVNVTIFNTSVTSEHIEKLMISFGKQGEVSSLSGMWNLMSLLSMSRKMCETFCEDLFLNKKLMAELKGSVDLVLCDLSNLCCTVFSELLGVPHVSVITVAFMEPLVTSIIEMPEIILHMSVQFGKIADNAAENDQQMEHLSFANRLKNTLIYFFAQMILTGEFIPTRLWDDHAKGISKYSSAYEAFWKRYGIVLVSHDFAFTYPQPLYANVKMIGPVLPKPAKNLSAELEKFMSVHKKVVLVSFGTVLSQYNEELLNTLSAGLSKVPLQVLWKHSGVPPTFVGNNTKIVQWMPQNDILGHMSTAVFLTHGGLNSFQESVYHGVPVIVMPLFGDQHWAASVCTQKQLGVVLDKADLEPHKVSEAVMEVVKNNVYKQNVMIISKRLKHRKRTSAQEGADWIEYALENDGAYHLRSPAGNLAFYQRYMLDVFLFICLIAFLLMFLIMKMLKCIFCRVTEQRKDKKKYS